MSISAMSGWKSSILLPSAVKAILEAAEICSFDKLMWGSDYPRTMVEITYKMSFDFVVKSKLGAQASANASSRSARLQYLHAAQWP